jgi:hypothetical protein
LDWGTLWGFEAGNGLRDVAGLFFLVRCSSSGNSSKTHFFFMAIFEPFSSVLFSDLVEILIT